jgi:hypothetical protein
MTKERKKLPKPWKKIRGKSLRVLNATFKNEFCRLLAMKAALETMSGISIESVQMTGKKLLKVRNNSPSNFFSHRQGRYGYQIVCQEMSGGFHCQRRETIRFHRGKFLDNKHFQYFVIFRN